MKPTICSVNSGLQIRVGTSEIIEILAVPPKVSAVRIAVSFILRTRSSLESLSFVRIVPSRTAVSGMILAAVPAWNLPTVIRQALEGSVSRAITDCSAKYTWAAILIGSTEF